MPDFEDSAHWELYLQTYCNTVLDVEGAALATMDGVLIASVLPRHIGKERLVTALRDIASQPLYTYLLQYCADGHLEDFRLTPHRSIVICSYPTKGKLLITLWREGVRVDLSGLCPDLSNPPTAAKASNRLGPHPRQDEGEAEAEL